MLSVRVARLALTGSFEVKADRLLSAEIGRCGEVSMNGKVHNDYATKKEENNSPIFNGTIRSLKNQLDYFSQH